MSYDASGGHIGVRGFLTEREPQIPPGIDPVVWLAALVPTEIHTCIHCTVGNHHQCPDISEDYIVDIDDGYPVLFCDCYKDDSEGHRSYREHRFTVNTPWGPEQIFQDLLEEIAAEVYRDVPPAKPTVDELVDDIVDGTPYYDVARTVCDELIEALRQHGYINEDQ